jgi:probable HAF family extracellular repeat protein
MRLTLPNDSRRLAVAIVTIAAAIALAALTVTRAPTAFAQSVAMSAQSSRLAALAVSHQGRPDTGLRGHGFVRDAEDRFTTIDVPGAGAFTLAFGLGEDGNTVGGYVDRRGRLHGFLFDRGKFKVIDFPGARATFVARMNAHGQIVGAYSSDPNAPATELSHGFLLEGGAFTPIEVPGARRTQPFGINNHGQIVGEYADAEGRSHGFLMENGVFTTIDAPDSVATIAIDIDDMGRIVGIAGGSLPGVQRGFRREADGSFTTIEVPDGTQTFPFGINNRGQVVGRYIDPQGRSLGFLFDSGNFTSIAPPQAIGDVLVFDLSDDGQLAGTFDLIRHGYLQDRRAFTTIDHPDSVLADENGGLNNRGEIVGGYQDAAGGVRGFLLNRKGFTSIEVPGASLTSAYKINTRGQIVGIYEEGSVRHGFLLDDDGLIAIDFPGALQTQAYDIDNHGRVVGEYLDSAGTFHGFERDPGGAFTTIDVPGSPMTSILGSNDRGQMVGIFGDAAGAIRAFMLDDGAITTIDIPGAALTVPFGLNNRGQVVGLSFDGLRSRGFSFKNGKVTMTAAPPGTFGTAFAFDVDDRGRILGAFF